MWTYNSSKSVSWASVEGNCPVRLLELRMLESPTRERERERVKINLILRDNWNHQMLWMNVLKSNNENKMKD